jgi:hypothetical protein
MDRLNFLTVVAFISMAVMSSPPAFSGQLGNRIGFSPNLSKYSATFFHKPLRAGPSPQRVRMNQIQLQSPPD